MLKILDENKITLPLKLKIKTLTPVHIGSNESINRSKYIFDKEENKVYIIDEKKWGNFLVSQNLLDDFMNSLNRKVDVFRWLNRKNFNNFESVSKYILNTEKLDNKCLDRDTFNDISLCIKDSNKKPYIPGSSIKGAIRTSICVSKILELKNSNKDKYKSMIKSALNERLSWKRSRLLNTVITNIERDLKLNNNFFKGISVSDSESFDYNSMCLIQKNDFILSKEEEKKESELPIFREFIKPDLETEFSIKIDKNIVSDYLVNGYEGLIKILNKNSDFINSKIYSKFQKLYNFSLSVDGGMPNLCLGGANGLFNKSLIYAICLDDKESTYIVKKLLDMKFPKHKHFVNDSKVSPRALKIAQYDDINYIPGWCRIKK